VANNFNLDKRAIVSGQSCGQLIKSKTMHATGKLLAFLTFSMYASQYFFSEVNNYE
jgi:hypothetical protein